jgi:hypothetical protein
MSLQDERLNHGSMIMTEASERYVYRRFTRKNIGLASEGHVPLSHSD